MISDSIRQSGAVAIFSGLATLMLEGISLTKIIGAFAIAGATGAGYTLGSLIVKGIVGWVRSRGTRK